MDAQTRTRRVQRERSEPSQQSLRGAKQIVIPMTRQEYDTIWTNPLLVRARLEALLPVSPEIFPSAMAEGFTLDGLLRESAKQPQVRLRKILLNNGSIWTLRPSFVMPYMMGTVDDLEHPLLLLSLGVPCWALTIIFGHNDMYWYRLLERLGRNSLVGATVRDPARLPQDIVADEHHVDWCGEKGYIATTAGSGCLLGLALTKSADETHLQAAYSDFAAEARDVSKDYAPRTVNTDGWSATQNAFRALFEGIAVILCFLHGFLKIRDRCRKNFELHRHVWDVFRAATAEEFHRLMSELKTWCSSQTWPQAVSDMLAKLFHKTAQYAVAYEHPGCHRTSNLVDRLMNRLYRSVYASRGLHGHQASSERRLRGWALLLNYRPFAPRSGQPRQHHSPAHRLNDKCYDPHWLHNLNTATSMLGYRTLTPTIR